MTFSKDIKKLEEKIRYHKAMYYQGRSEISDHDYDELENKLKQVSPDSSVLKMVGSYIKSSEKEKHTTKMLSLNKTYKEEELESWMDGNSVVSTFKIDGASASLIYQDGIFQIGKTRGDGSFGENITEKLRWLNSIPNQIEPLGLIEIRGEVFCKEMEFFSLASEMEELGLEKPMSQRNIVAGLLGRKESIELCRYLEFQAFEIISDKIEFKNEVEKSHLLEKMGFSIPETLVHNSLEDVLPRIKDAREFMSMGDYLIDGLVLSYNSIELQNTLGETSHHPRYKIAFKFQGESKKSKITNIEWNVSRNGTLTPVGIITPVELSGAIISRVTLHNYGMVKLHNLKINDEIELVRSGEVIPKFLQVINSSKENFSFPKKCPECNSKTIIKEIRLKCSNDQCIARKKEEILNFIQKIGIDDISSKRLGELLKTGLVKEIADLYSLKISDFLKLEKVKEKLADKMYQTIQKSLNIELKVFLSALGINGGAINRCEKIINAGFNTIESIENLTVDKLISIDGFAEKSATEFYNSLARKLIIIQKIKDKFNFKHIEKKESKITDLKICITGTLSEKRSLIENRIRDNGGIVVTSVTKNTNILVCNSESSESSKYKKAKKLDIKIISENDLGKLIT